MFVIYKEKLNLNFPNSKLPNLHLINVDQNTKLPSMFIFTNLDLKLVYELLLNHALDSSESTDGLKLKQKLIHASVSFSITILINTNLTLHFFISFII